jgi:hypothetical protein
MSEKLAIALAAAMLAAACGRGVAPPPPKPQPRGAHGCAAVHETTASGSTKVPAIKYGTSVDDAMAHLERAGLCGQSPNVDFPHYVIGTKPAAGSVVERGAQVALLIGDG